MTFLFVFLILFETVVLNLHFFTKKVALISDKSRAGHMNLMSSGVEGGG